MLDLDKALALVAKHEGFRATAYLDSRGYLTIGYGTDLDAVGAQSHCEYVGLDYAALRAGDAVTEQQARELLTEAVQSAIAVGHVIVVGLMDMPENVQLVVADMIYNLGAAGFVKFARMIAALERHDWQTAAAEMKDSLWYGQVGQRGADDVALLLGAS